MCVLSSLAASIAAVASAAHFQQGEVRPGVIFAITAIVWTVTVGLTAARG
jgi:ribose/xylose/arabinose/galactoside ABC-type transport system permease subunit